MQRWACVLLLLWTVCVCAAPTPGSGEFDVDEEWDGVDERMIESRRTDRMRCRV